MSMTIGVTKAIEQDADWSIYQTYVAPGGTHHHVLDLQLVLENGEQISDFLAKIKHYIDADFSYRYLVESHQVNRIDALFQYRVTMPLYEFLDEIELLYGMPLARIPDDYTSYIGITVQPQFSMAKVSSRTMLSNYFLIPFLKGLLLHTPDLGITGNISFIGVSNTLNHTPVYLLLGNQLYGALYSLNDNHKIHQNQ
ncbi:hypothetical protein [Pustulibacterium marinum]|nr:hypothetical protein [Pustulibacterium marinum]